MFETIAAIQRARKIGLPRGAHALGSSCLLDAGELVRTMVSSSSGILIWNGLHGGVFFSLWSGKYFITTIVICE